MGRYGSQRHAPRRYVVTARSCGKIWFILTLLRAKIEFPGHHQVRRDWGSGGIPRCAVVVQASSVPRVTAHQPGFRPVLHTGQSFMQRFPQANLTTRAGREMGPLYVLQHALMLTLIFVATHNVATRNSRLARRQPYGGIPAPGARCVIHSASFKSRVGGPESIHSNRRNPPKYYIT